MVCSDTVCLAFVLIENKGVCISVQHSSIAGGLLIFTIKLEVI